MQNKMVCCSMMNVVVKFALIVVKRGICVSARENDLNVVH